MGGATPRAGKVREEAELQAQLLLRLEMSSGGSGTAEEGEGVDILEGREAGGGGSGWLVSKCYRSRRSELVRWGALVRIGERLRRGEQVVLAADSPDGRAHAEQLATWLTEWVDRSGGRPEDGVQAERDAMGGGGGGGGGAGDAWRWLGAARGGRPPPAL